MPADTAVQKASRVRFVRSMHARHLISESQRSAGSVHKLEVLMGPSGVLSCLASRKSPMTRFDEPNNGL